MHVRQSGQTLPGVLPLGDDHFLADFQREIGRDFLLDFHQFIRVLQLYAHADHFGGFHPAVHDGTGGGGQLGGAHADDAGRDGFRRGSRHVGEGAVIRGGKHVDFLDADDVAQLDRRHLSGGDFQGAFLRAGEEYGKNEENGSEFERIHDTSFTTLGRSGVFQSPGKIV
ncbi:MAG: hypothetical protein ACLU7D_09565 [Collinsella sp.]